jgi:hypothetical protein
MWSCTHTHESWAILAFHINHHATSFGAKQAHPHPFHSVLKYCCCKLAEVEDVGNDRSNDTCGKVLKLPMFYLEGMLSYIGSSWGSAVVRCTLLCHQTFSRLTSTVLSSRNRTISGSEAPASRPSTAVQGCCLPCYGPGGQRRNSNTRRGKLNF